jgi:HEAT repeat protein
VSAAHFLVVIGLAQGALVAALIVLLFLHRRYQRRRAAALGPARRALDEAMRAWALGAADEGPLLARLSALPPPAAVDALVAWVARVPGERWAALAALLAQEDWARAVRAEAAAPRWWRRLEAARLLAATATPQDVPLVLALLRDAHPAVHVAAVGAVERVPDPLLVSAALDRLADLTPTVHAYYGAALQRSRVVLVDLLVARLQPATPAVARYAEFAARLADPGLRIALTALATHPEAEVRVQAARALGGYPHPESVAALLELLRDAAWEVRAQAARALGRLGDPRVVAALRSALEDPEWWVRLRAALALGRYGAAGRDALVHAETGPGPLARQMARLVLGLSPQALAEFAV